MLKDLELSADDAEELADEVSDALKDLVEKGPGVSPFMLAVEARDVVLRLAGHEADE